MEHGFNVAWGVGLHTSVSHRWRNLLCRLCNTRYSDGGGCVPVSSISRSLLRPATSSRTRPTAGQARRPDPTCLPSGGVQPDHVERKEAGVFLLLPFMILGHRIETPLVPEPQGLTEEVQPQNVKVSQCAVYDPTARRSQGSSVRY
jgi:hypothetical protein